MLKRSQVKCWAQVDLCSPMVLCCVPLVISLASCCCVRLRAAWKGAVVWPAELGLLGALPGVLWRELLCCSWSACNQWEQNWALVNEGEMTEGKRQHLWCAVALSVWQIPRTGISIWHGLGCRGVAAAMGTEVPSCRSARALLLGLNPGHLRYGRQSCWLQSWALCLHNPSPALLLFPC